MKKQVRRTKKIIAAPKNCFFCKENKQPDFLEYEILGRFTSERGKILSSQKTGICALHQRKLTDAIKRARYMALMPFIVRPD